MVALQCAKVTNENYNCELLKHVSSHTDYKGHPKLYNDSGTFSYESLLHQMYSEQRHKS